MNKRNAEILLIAVIILRSTSYLFSKIGLATLPPLEILAIRFFLSFLILGLIFYNHLHRTVTKPLLRSAANLGAILFACMACELISLTTIDSSMASFLENTAVAWVPLILAVKNRALPNKSTSICTLVIVCGIGLLTLNTTEFHLSSGELICLCGSVCYAFGLSRQLKKRGVSIRSLWELHNFSFLHCTVRPARFFLKYLYSNKARRMGSHLGAYLYLYHPGVYAPTRSAALHDLGEGGTLHGR